MLASAKRSRGSLKEAIGKVTGDTKLEAEGTAQKAVGNAQNARWRCQGYCSRHR